MKMFRKIPAFFKSVFLLAMLAVPAVLSAQESRNGEFYASVDLSTKHLWRGLPAGESPMVKPTAGYNIGNFDIYFWGAIDFKDTYREANIGLRYAFGNFSLELMDYFYPRSKDDVFELANNSTTHQVELIAYYEFENVPFHITAGTFIYGDDKNEKGNQAFSTYLEGGYSYEFNEKNSLSAVAGVSLGKSLYNDYSSNFDVVNLTAEYTRLFDIFNYELLATLSYTYNPYLEKSWIYLTLSFGF